MAAGTGDSGKREVRCCRQDGVAGAGWRRGQERSCRAGERGVSSGSGRSYVRSLAAEGPGRNQLARGWAGGLPGVGLVAHIGAPFAERVGETLPAAVWPCPVGSIINPTGFAALNHDRFQDGYRRDPGLAAGGW